MKISIFLNAICFFALVTCENYYFTELGEFKVPLKHENLTIDSRINMTDIETNIQVSYSALTVLGKGCKKHRIDCNDTIFELTVNLEEIENRLDNIFSLVDSNRVRPKKIAHPTLNEEWLNALEGHHEKCGDILANEFTKVENNILTDYSRAGEITAAILDMKQNILHPLLFSPLNTVKEMKLSSYKDQFLYKPVNLFNYNKIIKFVTFSMLPSPEDSTIFLKMDIPVFEPTSEKMTLHKMNVPLNGEEFGYMVTRSEADNLKYFFKKDILDCTVVQEPREVLYICQEKEEFLDSGADDFDCISEALNENSLDLLCRLQYNFRERFFVCVIVGVLMVLSLVVMAVIMVVIRRRNREQRYEYLLKY